MVYCIKTSYDFREFVNERKKKKKKKTQLCNILCMLWEHSMYINSADTSLCKTDISLFCALCDEIIDFYHFYSM